jgi:hypothetical protein
MALELLSQPPEIKDQPLDAIPLRRLDLPFFDGMTALGEAAKGHRPP